MAEVLISLDGYQIVHDEPDERAKQFFDAEGEVIHARRLSDNKIVGRLWLLSDSIDDEMPGDEDDEFYEPPQAAADCTEGYIALKKKYGRALDGVMRVRWVEVLERGERRRGLGSALYVGAAMVAKRSHAAIVADDCYDSGTSPDAHRVWSGKTLRKYCDVRNNAVAFFTGDPKSGVRKRS